MEYLINLNYTVKGREFSPMIFIISHQNRVAHKFKKKNTNHVEASHKESHCDENLHPFRVFGDIRDRSRVTLQEFSLLSLLLHACSLRILIRVFGQRLVRDAISLLVQFGTLVPGFVELCLRRVVLNKGLFFIFVVTPVVVIEERYTHALCITKL